MIKRIAFGSVGLLLCVSPLFVSADVISDLQAQINALLAQLSALKSQGQMPAPPIPYPYDHPSDDYPTVPIGSSCPKLTLTMQRGARDATTGGQVTELQIWLAKHFNLNEEDVVTGYFGPTTERYVIQFQKAQGLPAFGIVGTLTRATIAKLCNDGPPIYPSPCPTYPVYSCPAGTAWETFKSSNSQNSCPPQPRCVPIQSGKCGVNTFNARENKNLCPSGGYDSAYYQCHDGFSGEIHSTSNNACVSDGGLWLEAERACAQRCASAAGINVTSPNGGEQWEIGALNTITWSPYSYSPTTVNGSNQVTVNLLQKMDTCTTGEKCNWFSTIGKIMDTGKASLHTYFNINDYQTWAKPGQYYVQVINNVTGAVDTSDAPFTLLQRPVDLQVNGQDGGVVLPNGTTPFQLTWELRSDVYACSLEGVNVPPLSIAPPRGGIVGTLAFVPPAGAFTSVAMKCLGPGGVAKSDYVSVQVRDQVSASSVQVLSPNGGERIALNEGLAGGIKFAQSGLKSVSVALYKDDQWLSWIHKDVINSQGTTSVPWAPSSSLVTPGEVGKNIFKIYITGLKADGTGYIDDKSDAPFSLLNPLVNVLPPVSGSKSFAVPGTHQFVVPQYSTLSVTVDGGSGGGGGGFDCSGGYTAYADPTSGGPGGSSSFGSATPVVSGGGGGGSRGGGSGGEKCFGYSTGARGADGDASGGDVNTAGGGVTGGRGGLRDSEGGAGGNGGRSVMTWTPAKSGAPVPGSTITITVGAGGTAGTQARAFPPSNPAPESGKNGGVVISWQSSGEVLGASTENTNSSQLAAALTALKDVLKQMLQLLK